MAKGASDLAEVCFVKSLNSAQVWDKQAAMLCAENLLEIHKKNKNMILYDKIAREFPSLSGVKHITFVLDTSGSMVDIIG